MSATLKPLFAAEASITITLDSLANTSTATSNAVDNSSNLYEEIDLELKVNGTAASTAWCDVRMLRSIDGGTDYDTWESAQVLPPLLLAVTPQIYHARFIAPAHFKIAVKNNTGAALGGSSNVASYRGINTQSV